MTGNYLLAGEVACARLEVSRTAFDDHFLFGRRVLIAEILQARLAVTAFDDIQMEAEVVFLPGVEDAEEMAAELFARRAAETMAAPDGAERVDAGVATAEQVGLTEQQVANFKFDFLERLRKFVKQQRLSEDVFPELHE